jgi:hypothetical protein
MLGIGRGDAPDGGTLESLRRRAWGPAVGSDGGASRRCAAGPGDSALASARLASSAAGGLPGNGDSGAIGGGGSPVAVSRIDEPAGATGVLGGVGGPGARSPPALGAP